jgi:hypothetical protein
MVSPLKGFMWAGLTLLAAVVAAVAILIYWLMAEYA